MAQIIGIISPYPFLNPFITGKGKFGTAMERGDEDGFMRLTREVTNENDTMFIVNELPIKDEPKCITLAMLKRQTLKSKAAIKARTITTYAETAIRNCKLASAFGKQFIQPNGSLPSGWSRQDYFNNVLDLMYQKVMVDPKGKSIMDGEEREEMLSKDRPPRWVFNGYMAFVLYGPLADEQLQSKLMSGTCK